MNSDTESRGFSILIADDQPANRAIAGAFVLLAVALDVLLHVLVLQIGHFLDSSDQRVVLRSEFLEQDLHLEQVLLKLLIMIQLLVLDMVLL